MPQYVVDIVGPDGGKGTITVNASNPEAAMQNASQGGNTPVGMSGGGGGGGTQSSSTGGTQQSGGGGQSYNTINGPKTLTQMQSELNQAGYDGPTDQQSIINAYARTAGGTVTEAAPANDQTYTNTDQVQQYINNANQAAYQAYLNSKLNLESDQLAFQKAQQAWTQTFQTAQLTGTLNGQPTLPAMQAYAGLFGTWGVPTPGQETLASQAQAANFLGQYQGQDTLAKLAQQAGFLGTYQGQQTLQAQQQYWQQAFNQQAQNQKVVQDYLSLLSQLRGPQDYGQYLRVMASTPQGLQSLVGAASGAQGRVPTFGVTGTPTQPATLGGFMGQAATGGTAPGGTSYADYQNAVGNLPPPSQIAPQNWNAMSDSQKRILLGMYEAAGWNVTDALQQYQSSLPQFGGTPQTGSMRLV